MQMRNLSVLLLLAASNVTLSNADESCVNLLRAVSSKTIKEHNFIVGRSLFHYAKGLGDVLFTEIRSLGPNKTIIDAGCGDGVFLQTLLEGFKGWKPSTNGYWYFDHLAKESEKLANLPLSEKPNLVGITYQRKKVSGFLNPKSEKKIHFIEGMFEDIPLDQIPKGDLIIDYYGITAYSSQIDLVWNKYIELLNPGGKILLYLGDGTEVLAGTVRKKNGGIVPIRKWLESIPGLKITSHAPKGIGTTMALLIEPMPGARIPNLVLERAPEYTLVSFPKQAVRKYREIF